MRKYFGKRLEGFGWQLSRERYCPHQPDRLRIFPGERLGPARAYGARRAAQERMLRASQAKKPDDQMIPSGSAPRSRKMGRACAALQVLDALSSPQGSELIEADNICLAMSKAL